MRLGGRNDVLVGGRRYQAMPYICFPTNVSFLALCCFDTNLQHMINAISPSGTKLDARGISSVKSRITTLRSNNPELDISEFKKYARHAFCGDEVFASTPSDVVGIYHRSLEYYHPSWIYGDSVSDTHSYIRRIEGVGNSGMRLNPSRLYR